MMKWLISWSCSDRGRHRGGKGMLSINDSAFASPFLSPSLLLQSAEEVLLRQNSLSVTGAPWQRCCEGYFSNWAADRVQPVCDSNFASTSSSMFFSTMKLGCRNYGILGKQSDLPCCQSWGSWYRSSRSQTLTLMHALWWDYWHRSTSRNLETKEEREVRQHKD